MENTQQKLHQLFEKWKQEIGSGRFIKDGIFFRAEEQERYTAWESAPKRVLFIAKEPREDAVDLAEEWCNSEFYGNDKYAPCQYLYITAICDHNPAFETIVLTPEAIRERFEKTPFCWINIKKIPGGASAKAKEIAYHLKEYGDLLLQEIEILKPTDIVCLCGGNNGAVIKTINAAKEAESLSFHPTLYTAYHPAAYRRSHERKYRSLESK